MINANNSVIHLGPSVGLPKKVEKNFQKDFTGVGVLYKHCKGIHLPKIGGSIRLGTLSEYRRNDNSAVRDEFEGTFNVTLDFKKNVSVKLDQLRQATVGTWPFGIGDHANNFQSIPIAGDYNAGSAFSTDNATLKKVSDNGVIVKGNVNIHFEGADAYVLCLSTSDDVNTVISDATYDSIWSILPGCALLFANQMLGFLEPYIFNSMMTGSECLSHETIGPLSTPGFSHPPQGEYMNFHVVPEIWTVAYRDRNIEVSEGITSDTVKQVYGNLDRSASIKPKIFSHEMEVRILFRPTVVDKRDGKRYLFPNYLKPILVPFQPFLDFIDVTLDPARHCK